MYFIDDDEIEAVLSVLKSGKLFRYQGEGVSTECFKFENEFSEFIDEENEGFSLLTTSGTNSLELALFCQNIRPGDEVIVPAYTFFATLAAVISRGALPIIANIDETLNMDIDMVEGLINTKTKAIITVHMDGHSSPLDELLNLSKKYELGLIEDVAQSVGGKYKGKRLGSFGHFGCFSFNVDKIITCGEGGAFYTKNSKLYQKAMMYHDTCNQFGPTLKNVYNINPFVGKSMRVSEIQGAMMRAQLKKIDKILILLKKRKFKLDNALLDMKIPMVFAIDPEGGCSTTTRVMLPDPITAKKVAVELQKIGLRSINPLFRPGHNPWGWLPLLPDDKRNTKLNVSSSVEILSRIVNINISLQESDEEWDSKISLLNKIF